MHVCSSGFCRPRGLVVRAERKGFGTKPVVSAKRKSGKAPKPGPQSSSPGVPTLQQESQPAQPPPYDDEDDDDSAEADGWSAAAQRGGQQTMEVSAAVNDRILRRILTFAGLPTFLGFALFPLFYWVKVAQHIDLPMGFVYITQSFVFGGGLLGIWYGILSASWEEQREGSALGFQEFKANLPVFLDKIRGRGA